MTEHYATLRWDAVEGGGETRIGPFPSKRELAAAIRATNHALSHVHVVYLIKP